MPPREGRGDDRVPRRTRGYQEDGQGRGAEVADRPRAGGQQEHRRQVRGHAGHVARAPAGPEEGPPGHGRPLALDRRDPGGGPVGAAQAEAHGQEGLRQGRGRDGLRGWCFRSI